MNHVIEGPVGVIDFTYVTFGQMIDGIEPAFINGIGCFNHSLYWRTDLAADNDRGNDGKQQHDQSCDQRFKHTLGMSSGE